MAPVDVRAVFVESIERDGDVAVRPHQVLVVLVRLNVVLVHRGELLGQVLACGEVFEVDSERDADFAI